MKVPAHQVIYTHGGGRLGNQIIRFAHWIAWVRAHGDDGVEVLDLAFWPFAQLFSVWREHPGCVFPVRSGREDWLARRLAAVPPLRRMVEASNRLQRAVQAAGHWMPGWQAVELDISGQEGLQLDDHAFAERVTRRSVTTCSGWKIANWRLVAEQETELREFFRPEPEFARSAADFVGALRKRHDLVIGLFIRQTDYRVWWGGRFCFSTAHYANWIRQLLALHGDRRVAVVVAADEWQDPALFLGLPCHFASGTPNAGGHWFETWVELSLCDLVVSPPSTFAATAAFLGGIPLWPLSTIDQAMAFDQLIDGGMIGAAQHPVFSLSVQ